jgi:hypothetical protein
MLLAAMTSLAAFYIARASVVLFKRTTITYGKQIV